MPLTSSSRTNLSEAELMGNENDKAPFEDLLTDRAGNNKIKI